MNSTLTRFRIGSSAEKAEKSTSARPAQHKAGPAVPTGGRVGLGSSPLDAVQGRSHIDADSISKRIAARDTTALGQLYDLMGRRAFGLAYTVTGDATLAEDAVQDAFLSLWKQAETVSNSRGKIESLLLTMVHRRAVDHVRKRAKTDRTNATMQAERQPPSSKDPEQLAVASAQQAEAVHALKSLPQEQRHVIELAYFRGMTQREIADETGVSLGTVKGRIRLGLEKLRTAFGLSEGRS